MEGDPKGPRLENPYTSLERIRRQKLARDPWASAQALPHVREGRYCGICRHFADKEKGQEELRRDSFWERAFAKRPDGSEFKTWQLGNPADYSLCEKRNCACHQYSTCEEFDR